MMTQKENQNCKIILVGDIGWCVNLKNQLIREGVTSNIIKNAPANLIKRLLWLRHFYKIMENCSIVHIMSPYGAKKVLRAAKCIQKPIICHWVGSDVLKLNEPEKKKNFLKSCPNNVVHIAVSHKLKDELKSHDIDVAHVVMNITDKVLNKIEPLPEKPAVLSYWCDKRAEFYNISLIFELARYFPCVPFTVVGASGENTSPPDNIKFAGFRHDVLKYVKRSTVYIRLIPHDGGFPPRLVAESLSMGRYVIYNHRCPGCDYVNCKPMLSELKIKLDEVLKRKEPNYVGAKYVKENLNPKTNIQKLIKIYKDIIP